MTMTDPRPGYRINWVAEQTGIPEATLRAWERRYGVPEPERTPSGYRIYSVNDVKKVQRMRELCAGGMSPSQAALAVADDAQPREPSVDGVGELRLSEVLGPQHVGRSGAVSLAGVLSLMERAATMLCSARPGQAEVPVGAGPVRLQCAAQLGDTVTTTARFEAADEHTVMIEVQVMVGREGSAQQRLATGHIELQLVFAPPLQADGPASDEPK